MKPEQARPLVPRYKGEYPQGQFSGIFILGVAGADVIDNQKLLQEARINLRTEFSRGSRIVYFSDCIPGMSLVDDEVCERWTEETEVYEWSGIAVRDFAAYFRAAMRDSIVRFQYRGNSLGESFLLDATAHIIAKMSGRDYVLVCIPDVSTPEEREFVEELGVCVFLKAADTEDEGPERLGIEHVFEYDADNLESLSEVQNAVCLLVRRHPAFSAMLHILSGRFRHSHR